jgi:death-on-curing protein
MTEPKWLSPDDVVELQAIAIERDGGLSGGLTRPDLLESALARPQNEFVYREQEDLFALAAIYAEGIAKNHAFADANKRTAFLAAAQFLFDNGWQLLAAKGSGHADMMVSLAKDDVSREEMADYLRANSQTVGG